MALLTSVICRPNPPKSIEVWKVYFSDGETPDTLSIWGFEALDEAWEATRVLAKKMGLNAKLLDAQGNTLKTYTPRKGKNG